MLFLDSDVVLAIADSKQMLPLLILGGLNIVVVEKSLNHVCMCYS